MRDRTLRLTTGGLVLVTIGIASYLLHAHSSGGSVVCSTGGCRAVEQSRYSDVFGVPVALIGLLGSLAILATLVRDDRPTRAAGVALALTGTIFAAYLVVVQLTVLHAVCEWCVANDAAMSVIALLALLRARADLSTSAPVRPPATGRR
jgi:uncharacterized membrane protein